MLNLYHARIFFYFLIVGSSLGRRRELWEDLSLPVEAHHIELHHDPSVRGDVRRLNSEVINPLYQGYGTHFAYIYVGTPPQRQSVIIDTGSHLTAFPCTGCKNCGKHTDSYYNPKTSSTSVAMKCNISRFKTGPCYLSQSYAEGSSWKAVKTKDKLWVGGLTENMVAESKKYSVNFVFGCQSSETGLFRTQLADGIMGMSASGDTLPHQLTAQKVVASRTFALCFRVGGGIMTLGGVNQHIHAKPSIIQYALQVHPPGSDWFTVSLQDILIRNRRTSEKKSLGFKSSQLNRGKGVIVDSGTTDTYLPSAFKSKFMEIFKKMSGGVAYNNKNNKLTQAQLDQLPDIVFVFTGADNNGKIEVIMPWSNYVEKAGNGVYAFRIYLSEGSGSVLGANFMNGQNVIFDRDNNRIGFAASSCDYEKFAVDKGLKDVSLTPVVENTTEIDIANNFSKTAIDTTGNCESTFVPLDLCMAKCDQMNAEPAQYVSTGWQKGVDGCKINVTQLESNAGMAIPSDAILPDRKCHELCDRSTVVSGSRPLCIVEEWSECLVDKTTKSGETHSCSQSRRNVKLDKVLKNKHELQLTATCGMFKEKRPCFIDACPVDSDYIVYVDMKVQIPSAVWSYAYTNIFISALSEMFKIPAGSIDLLNNAGDHDLVQYVKLHFELRLQAAYFNHDMALLTEVAEAIPIAVKAPQFSLDFIHLLNFISHRDDEFTDFSRYGWMRRRDLTVTNALVLPLGNARPIVVPGPNEVEHHSPFLMYLLIGIAVAAVALLGCVLCVHIKLRQEHDDLSKEKIRTSSWRTVFNALRSTKKVTGNQRYMPVSSSELELHSLRDGRNMYELDDVIDDENISDNVDA